MHANPCSGSGDRDPELLASGGQGSDVRVYLG